MENPFICKVKQRLNETLSGRYSPTPPSAEIRPWIIDFFKKSIEAKIPWDEGMVWKLTEIVMYLSQNTRNYHNLSEPDVTSLKKIFDELDALFEEVLKRNSHDRDDLILKISCISEILCKNQVDMHDTKEDHDSYRDGMIFQSYENLWKIIHRINYEWVDLCKRGFSLEVFFDYWKSFSYERFHEVEKTEEEKLDVFMAILDGTKKFVPVYEVRPVAFKIMDNDFEGDIVYTIKHSKSYRMRQEGELETK